MNYPEKQLRYFVLGSVSEPAPQAASSFMCELQQKCRCILDKLFTRIILS